MAIPDYATLKSRLATPYQRIQICMGGPSSAGLVRPYSGWTIALNFINGVGVAPTTAVAPDRTTAGAMSQVNANSGVQRIARALGLGEQYQFTIIADRLSHQGGLDGTVTGAQTTNLPTAALTRYTSGVGVYAALEIYTAVGATATTATISYTNTAGTAGRTSLAVIFGGTGSNNLRRWIPIPLQQGDLGVKSVESVTLAASTLTAGNFGVTLFKPLFPVACWDFGKMQLIDGIFTLGGILPQVVDNACLWPIFWSSIAGAPDIGFSVKFIRE